MLKAPHSKCGIGVTLSEVESPASAGLSVGWPMVKQRSENRIGQYQRFESFPTENWLRRRW